MNKTREFRALVCLVSVLVVTGLLGSVRAEEVYTVFPTGMFPDDLINLQAVVNDLGYRGADGKIILEAQNESGVPTAFNFGEGDYLLGERGGIYVWSNAYIFGQDLGDIAFVGVGEGPAQTTIIGGIVSIGCWRRTKFEVRRIRFEGAVAAPIFANRCDSCEIKDNEIWNVEGAPGWGTYGESKAVGIWIAGNLDTITGHVEIKGNRIYNIVADSADGMAIVDTKATFEISSNEIHNVNRVGIFAIWYQEPVVIENNLVMPGPGNTPSTVGNNTGYGIMTIFSIGERASVRVEGNRIICENPLGSGILAAGGLDLAFDPEGTTEMYMKDSVFAENHITMTETRFGGIELYAADGPGFFDNEIAENTIDGSGAFAILAGGFVSGLPNGWEPELFDTRIEQNNIDGFVSAGWDVIFDGYTHDNSYVGGSETVLDLGHDNVIVREND